MDIDPLTFNLDPAKLEAAIQAPEARNRVAQGYTQLLEVHPSRDCPPPGSATHKAPPR